MGTSTHFILKITGVALVGTLSKAVAQVQNTTMNITPSGNPFNTTNLVIGGLIVATGLSCCVGTLWCIRKVTAAKLSNALTYPAVQPPVL